MAMASTPRSLPTPGLLQIEIDGALHSAPALQQCQPYAVIRRLDRQPYHRVRRLTRGLPRPKQHAKGTTPFGRELQPPDLLRLGLQRPRHHQVTRAGTERLLEGPQAPCRGALRGLV